ncbi:MAG TPA: ABC transporter ATP-binding protein [Cellulomonas sp.]
MRIRLDEFGFRYLGRDADALSRVDLDVAPGETVVLTGRSGCGKSTVIRAVNGLVPDFHAGTVEGRVLLDDRDVADLPSHERAALVGTVFQDPRSQFFTTTVDDEIAFACENLGLPSARIAERVERSAALVGVEALLGREVFALSSGQKQLVALASVLAADPAVLVLDEPAANLDALATAALTAALARLRAGGTTILVAEHRLAYLLPLADRVLRMDGGRIADAWTPRELLDLPEPVRVDLGLRDPAPAPGGSSVRRTRGTSAERPAESPAVASAGPSGDQPVRVEVRGLVVRVGGSSVLDGLDLDVRAAPGRVVGITGPIGSGKTTLARALCGLVRTRGEIRVDGRARSRRQRVAGGFFVMQDTDYQLFSDSAAHELELSRPGIDRAEVDRVLGTLGLGGLGDAHPLGLSGGQKQRLAIAAAAVNPARLVVLDEPTSGLDADGMRRVARILRDLAADGRLVLVTSHDEELLRECDAVRLALVPAAA